MKPHHARAWSGAWPARHWESSTRDLSKLAEAVATEDGWVTFFSFTPSVARCACVSIGVSFRACVHPPSLVLIRLASSGAGVQQADLRGDGGPPGATDRAKRCGAKGRQWWRVWAQ